MARDWRTQCRRQERVSFSSGCYISPSIAERLIAMSGIAKQCANCALRFSFVSILFCCFSSLSAKAETPFPTRPNTEDLKCVAGRQCTESEFVRAVDYLRRQWALMPESLRKQCEMEPTYAVMQRCIASGTVAYLNEDLTREAPWVNPDAPKVRKPGAQQTRRGTPLEPDAQILLSLKGKQALFDHLAATVRANGYACESISAVRTMFLADGFVLTCNRFRYDYDVEDKGGRWRVTVR